MADVAIERIAQIGIVVHDLDRAVEFYRDVLGLKFLFQAPPRMAFFDCGGVRLMLSLPEPELDHPGSILYFKVPDILSAHRTLSARGVLFAAEPHLVARLQTHDLYLAEFQDLDRNPLALMSEMARTEPSPGA